MAELKEAWATMSGGTVAAREIAALAGVMKKHCRSWPHCSNCPPVWQQGQVPALEEWTARVSLAAAQVSVGEVWRSGESLPIGNLSVSQALGHLHALVPMPESLRPLFVDTEDAWRIETQSFPRQAELEFERLRLLRLSFSRVFAFYKRIAAFSPTPPAYVTRVKTIENALKARHGTCRCEWGLLRVERWGESHWIRVRANDNAFRFIPCPYDDALAELAFGWGHRSRELRSHNAAQQQMQLILFAHELKAAGLLHYTKDAEVSAEGYLSTRQDIRTCCEWVEDSPLTALFNLAAFWEVESAYSALSVWLDKIEQGLPPWQRDDPKYCVRLCETDKSLSLVRWFRCSD